MNQGPGKNYTHTMCKCSRCLLRCWCVHSIPFLQVTELLIDLGQATNMNWYRCNHVGWHAVTNCVWSCACHHDIMCTLSYNHTHTILQIQAYTYKVGGWYGALWGVADFNFKIFTSKAGNVVFVGLCKRTFQSHDHFSMAGAWLQSGNWCFASTKY